jgi:hypothetical protein
VLVLDVAGMHDIEFTGARVVEDALDKLDRRHVAFALARGGNDLLENLARRDLLERIGTYHLLRSVDETVRALGPEESIS